MSVTQGRIARPSPDLRASVVVPARNEEALIGACLRALAQQTGVRPDEYEVLLVLDDCTDATAERAPEVARDHPLLRLHLLYSPGQSRVHPRSIGMEAACDRLLGLGRPEGLVASTDADSVVAPDWLAEQLRAVEDGSRAIGGRIVLENAGATLRPETLRWHAADGLRRHHEILERLHNGQQASGRAEHWQFSGASLALTAKTYRETGGLDPKASPEDEHLEAVLQRNGVPIDRLLSVRVTTSSRLTGRAEHGLARDLANATLGFREGPDA